MLRFLAVASVAVGACCAQPVDPRAQFEVASIKFNKASDSRSSFAATPGRFRVTAIPLEFLIKQAYGIMAFQLSGAPAWIVSERYDVEAKAEGNASFQEMVPMMQRLLEDRLQLKYHRETQQLPVYVLLVARAGKLKASEGECAPQGPRKPGDAPRVRCGAVGMFSGRIIGNNAKLAGLAAFLSESTGRIVLDKTELAGKYDFDLQWSVHEGELRASPGGATGVQPDLLPTDPQGPSVFTALQEQLGLKLESQKGPVDMFVIDHIERPSEN